MLTDYSVQLVWVAATRQEDAGARVNGGVSMWIYVVQFVEVMMRSRDEPLARYQGDASRCPLSSSMRSGIHFGLKTAKWVGKPVISANDRLKERAYLLCAFFNHLIASHTPLPAKGGGLD